MKKQWYKQENKKYSERRHAKKRAKQRYGIKLNRLDYMNLVDQIQRNEAVYLYKETNRKHVYYVYHKDIRLPVVYDKIRKEIITVLKEEHVLEQLCEVK